MALQDGMDMNTLCDQLAITQADIVKARRLLLRASTRPTLILLAPSPTPRVRMSIHPEGKSCGQARSRFECLFTMTLLPGAVPARHRHSDGQQPGPRDGGAAIIPQPVPLNLSRPVPMQHRGRPHSFAVQLNSSRSVPMQHLLDTIKLR